MPAGARQACLHGRLRLRLTAATPAERRLISRELDLAESPPSSNVDLHLRFADRVGDANEQLIGHDDIAFTPDSFVVIRSKHRARVQVPLDHLGGECELVYQHGGTRLPLLLPIVNLTAMTRGLLPLHAAAVRYGGKGALVTGWARGGKTTSLLGFMADGADYISDDWTYVDVARHTMFGLPKPLQVSDRQLAEQPGYLARVGSRQRWQMRSARLAQQVIEGMAAHRWGRKAVPATVLQHLVPALQRRRSVDVAPRRLFDLEADSLRGEEPRLDAIFFTMSHRHPEVRVAPVAAGELVERIALMLEQEYAEVMAVYRKFRFAYPDRRSPVLDDLSIHLREQLARLMTNMPAYLVHHPYPVCARTLCAALKPWL